MGEQGNLFVAVAVLKSSNSTDRFRKTMFSVYGTTENTTAAVIAAVIIITYHKSIVVATRSTHQGRLRFSSGTMLLKIS